MKCGIFPTILLHLECSIHRRTCEFLLSGFIFMKGNIGDFGEVRKFTTKLYWRISVYYYSRFDGFRMLKISTNFVKFPSALRVGTWIRPILCHLTQLHTVVQLDSTTLPHVNIVINDICVNKLSNLYAKHRMRKNNKKEFCSVISFFYMNTRKCVRIAGSVGNVTCCWL